jgi:hypothetical protein
LSITSDFDAQTAVERELVLRLASLLWRLRRTSAIETGLLGMQTSLTHNVNEQDKSQTDKAGAGAPMLPADDEAVRFGSDVISLMTPGSRGSAINPVARDCVDAPGQRHTVNGELAYRFLRLIHHGNGAFERLSRYEKRAPAPRQPDSFYARRFTTNQMTADQSGPWLAAAFNPMERSPFARPSRHVVKGQGEGQIHQAQAGQTPDRRSQKDRSAPSERASSCLSKAERLRSSSLRLYEELALGR